MALFAVRRPAAPPDEGHNYGRFGKVFEGIPLARRRDRRPGGHQLLCVALADTEVVRERLAGDTG